MPEGVGKSKGVRPDCVGLPDHKKALALSLCSELGAVMAAVVSKKHVASAAESNIHLLSHISIGEQSAWASLTSLLGAPQGQNQGVGLPGSHLELLGENLLPASCGLLQSSVPCGCGTEVCVCLLAVPGDRSLLL